MSKNLSVLEEKKPRQPGPNRDDLMQTTHDLGDALESAKRRSQKWLAWRKLNIKNECGVTTVIPHSPEAIATMESALDFDENDGDIIHHLAIAYHAWAWDLEISEPDKALPVWKKALYYWRKLQACGAFWRDLCAKGESLGETFEKSQIEEFRKNLMRSLLEIHVNFIRHYYELNKADLASRHINLIKQAQISPADRKHFEILVYEAMTSTVPKVVGEGHFMEALSTLDHFLDLFPAYPPALRNYLEITKQWVEQMSPSSQWEEILKLDKQVLPKWDTLNTSEHLHRYPLANNALSDLAGVLGRKHLAKARNLRLRERQEEQTSMELEGEEYQAYEQAILWLKRAENLSPDNFDVKTDIYNALLLRADFVAQFCLTTDESNVACQLLDQALSDCQCAMKIIPDEKAPRELAGRIHQIKAEYRLRHLPDGLSEKELAAHLKNVEVDLERAIQFNPENQSLKEMLGNIRETLGELKT
jgi:tetratricopeptide (TPR) repeat protein